MIDLRSQFLWGPMRSRVKFDSEGHSETVVRMWIYFFFLRSLNISFINRRVEPVKQERQKVPETYREGN